ncbi:dead deah box helicase [Pyrenophora seminiperda CCB06]|uniref:Dead deah box helicase n=1 Tax=Pyrenophora seminiperda CCB06 TaxID=1302712 RepID=A0A3M7MBD1_9PLEO|nr:dead deah box helicase [Pyrenophora seminiperda CCB06]
MVVRNFCSHAHASSMLPRPHHALKLFRRVLFTPVPAAHRCASIVAARRKKASSSSLSPAPPPPPPPPPPSQPAAQPKLVLREYQEECIQAVVSFLEAGHKRLGVSLATGAGKTVIFTHLIDRVPAVGNAKQTLILAHRRELVEQAARHCARTYADKHVDIEMGNVHASGAADITVASIQSIVSSERLEKFDPKRYKLILVDEAHHIVSPSYLNLLKHFGLRYAADWSNASVPALVGVSATLSRFDGRKLGAVIDQIVYHRSDYLDMIDEGWLSDVTFTTVEIKADLTKVGTATYGDFQTSSLSKAVNTDETNQVVVNTWFRKAKGRHSTLVFCVDLSHVTALTARFRKYGLDAQYVTGDTPAKIRSARIDSFRNGEFPILLNCGVFTEGTDIPNIDCVLLARPTKSRNLLVQMIGRGMRLHETKRDCHVIDMVSTLSTGVVSTPTLFGLDPDEFVEDMDAKSMKEQGERKELEKQREVEVAELVKTTSSKKLPGTIEFTDYDSIHDLIADGSSDQYFRSLSPNAWVSVGEGKLILSSNGGNYIKIEPSEDKEGHFVAKYYWKLPTMDSKTKGPYARARTIADGDSLEHVIHAADTFASEVFTQRWIARNQPWRRSPASQAQIDFLNKSRPAEDQLKPSDVTKGKAGDMITRIKFGVKGRYDKATAKQRVNDRIKQRAQTLRERLTGQAQVGPLAGMFSG